MSLGLFRCRICGEVYFGSHPSHCPYCGAHGIYMIAITDWKDENIGVDLSDISEKNLKTTLDLEFHASRLYRAAAGKSSSNEVKGFFKYLAKVEGEHYSVVCKLLGIEADKDIYGLGSDAKETDSENLAESKRLEVHATDLYRKFSEEAEEPRIKEFFKALADVEADHVKLDDEELLKIT
jgi:rubrerythrin